MTELLNHDRAAFLEEAEEQEIVEEAVLQAYALAHELDEEELLELRTELETRGVRIESEAEEDEPKLDLSFDVTAAGVPDSLTLFMNDIGRYPLLTAADEVELAKRIERGDRAAKE